MIQFGGLASGLDTAAIIEAILNVERVPIHSLEADRQNEQGKLSLIGTLKGHVQALRDKAEELSSLSGFLSHTITPSEEGVASFSVSGAPVAGSHTLKVTQLAQASRFTFTDTVADPDTDLGAGDISFNINGTAYQLTVGAADSSLNEIRDALNSLAGGDITANVVNTGTSASPQYQLVIAGDATGLSNALTGLTSTVAGLTDANVVELTTAQNAIAEVDGLTVNRDSNVFADVVDGITFTAEAADASKTISFTAAIDSEGIKSKLQGFVDAYNAVIAFTNTQNTYTEDDGVGGALFGDPMLRTVRSTLSSSLFNVDISTVVADSAGFSTLSLVGIKLATDGTLSIDDAKLEAKLAEDPDAFADLFTDSDGFSNTGALANTPAFFVDQTADDGVFDNLFRNIDQLVDDLVLADGSSVNGLFKRRESTINGNIDRINDRIEVLELRLEQTELSLIARFSALEEVIAGLNAQGDFLSQSLANQNQ
jgi:flagellar hook-associated protein 2